MTTALDTTRVTALRARERERFAAERPRTAALRRAALEVMPQGVPMSWLHDLNDGEPPFAAEGEGAWFTDVDGHRYLDVNIADTSMFCGYAPPPVVRAVSAAVRTGTQFLLPGEDAVEVARLLAARYRLPQWQFTLAATSANVEAMRLCRRATDRGLVLMFDGKYHGHSDEMQTELDDGRVVDEAAGLPPGNAAGVRLVPFNDPDALRATLRDERVACVLAEPAMTNTQGVIQPQPGFHDELRRITRDTGTMLILDETHTQICGHGGLTPPVGARAGRAHDRQVDRGRRPDRRVRHDGGARGTLRRLGRHRRHVVRQRALDGRRPRGADGGADARRVRPHVRARRADRRRHRPGRRGRGPAAGARTACTPAPATASAASSRRMPPRAGPTSTATCGR